jgi:hypothetical protein
VEHPRILDPSDPLLERVRGICLAYPEEVVIPSWGPATFRAGKRIYVVMSASTERACSIVFRPNAEEWNDDLQDDRFFIPPYGDKRLARHRR